MSFPIVASWVQADRTPRVFVCGGASSAGSQEAEMQVRQQIADFFEVVDDASLADLAIVLGRWIDFEGFAGTKYIGNSCGWG